MTQAAQVGVPGAIAQRAPRDRVRRAGGAIQTARLRVPCRRASNAWQLQFRPTPAGARDAAQAQAGRVSLSDGAERGRQVVKAARGLLWVERVERGGEGMPMMLVYRGSTDAGGARQGWMDGLDERTD